MNTDPIWEGLETICKSLEVIEKADPQTLVTEFHAAMGLPVATTPTVGTPEQRALRVRLMLEEVLEFAKAAAVSVEARGYSADGMPVFTICPGFAEPDLVQMTHELSDVQYVVSGTAVELCLPLREAVPVIHAANMRKLGPDGEPIVVDGKLRKPEGWTPADVTHLVK